MWKVRISVHIPVALSKLEIQMCVVSKKSHNFNCYNSLNFFVLSDKLNYYFLMNLCNKTLNVS